MSGDAGSDGAWWRDPRARWPAGVGIVSGGLTCLSAGWVWAHLPRRRGDILLAGAMAGTLFVEVLLVDLQRWRGMASHFNRSTPLDSFLYDAMGVLILFVSAVLLDLTVRLFFVGRGVAPDMLLAARAGMVFLVISCGLGIWVGSNGDLRVAAGLDADRFGAAGVPKFAHGVTIHAIQWLPAIAWCARRAGLSAGMSGRLVALALVGTAFILAYAVVQTLLGGPRFPPLPAGMIVLGSGAVCLIVALVSIVVSCRPSVGPQAGPP